MHWTTKLVSATCIICGLIFMQGCSRKVDGEVFVVTQGGESKKLGLVTIHAVPAVELADVKKEILNSYEKDIAKFLSVHEFPTLKEVHQRYLQAISNMKDLERKYERCAYGFLCESKIPKALEAKANEQIDIAKNELSQIFKAAILLMDVEQSLLPRTYLSAKIGEYVVSSDSGNSKTVKAQTDADGKFSMTLPSGDYVVIAFGDRQALKENYTWAVKLNSNESSIRLANDSMIETTCSKCYFSKEDLRSYEEKKRALDMFYSGPNLPYKCEKTGDNRGVMSQLVYEASTGNFGSGFTSLARCVYK